MAIITCPRCRIALRKARLGLICRECEGCWLRFEELDRAITVSEDLLRKAGLGATLKADKESKSISSTINCPICEDKLRRFPYLVDSGIMVDACSKHGMWLDDGELSAIRTYCRVNEVMPEPRKKPGFFARLFGRHG